MADILFKLRVLWWLLNDAVYNWKQYAWSKELDAPACCDGRECWCNGMTVREQWSISIDPPKGGEDE